MEYIINLCPNCKRKSKEMMLLKNSRYCPEDENRNKGRYYGFHYELLRCKCGRLLSWFDMIKAKEMINNIGRIELVEIE